MNIYQKLQKCRVELQKQNIKKSGKNEFAHFDYYELADFLPAVNELFDKYNLHSRFDIKEGTATLVIINSENPEESEVYQSPIAESQLKGCTPIQALGGVHTYMKRYLYLNALEITDGDLFDSVTVSEEAKPKAKNQLSNELLAECKELNIDLVNVAKYLKKTVQDLTEEEVRACVERKRGVQGK